MAQFFYGLGQIPIDRTGGSASDPAMDAGVLLLRQGGLLGVYPEGTRSPDGRLYRGHTGIARLALATGAPVIPTAVVGTRQIQPPGTIVPRRAPMSIRFGRPLEFASGPTSPQDVVVHRRITDEIMREVRLLSGQEYVDSYSPGPLKPERP